MKKSMYIYFFFNIIFTLLIYAFLHEKNIIWHIRGIPFEVNEIAIAFGFMKYFIFAMYFFSNFSFYIRESVEYIVIRYGGRKYLCKWFYISVIKNTLVFCMVEGIMFYFLEGEERFDAFLIMFLGLLTMAFIQTFLEILLGEKVGIVIMLFYYLISIKAGDLIYMEKITAKSLYLFIPNVYMRNRAFYISEHTYEHVAILIMLMLFIYLTSKIKIKFIDII